MRREVCVANSVYLRAWVGRIIGQACGEVLVCVRIWDLEEVLALLCSTGVSAGTIIMDVEKAIGGAVNGGRYRLIRCRPSVVGSRSSRS